MVTGIGTYHHPVFFNNITGGYLRPISSSSTTRFEPGPISRTGRFAALSARGPVPGHPVGDDVRSVYRFDLVTRGWDLIVADTDCSPRGISEDGEVTVLACGSRTSSSSEGTAHVVVYRAGVGEVFRADPGRQPRLSDDGRYVSFVRWAEAPEECTDDRRNAIFRHDLEGGLTERISPQPILFPNRGSEGGMVCSLAFAFESRYDMSPSGSTFAWGANEWVDYAKYFGSNYTAGQAIKWVFGWRDSQVYLVGYSETPDSYCFNDALNPGDYCAGWGTSPLTVEVRHVTDGGSISGPLVEATGMYGLWPGGNRDAGIAAAFTGTYPNGTAFHMQIGRYSGGRYELNFSNDGRVISGFAQSGWMSDYTFWCGGGVWSGSGLDTCAAVTTVGEGWPFGEIEVGLPYWQAVDPTQLGVGAIADPVNTATGELVETALDLLIPDLGGEVALARTYRSGDERAGVLGRGWRAGFEAAVSVDGASGAVTVSHPGGRQVVYRPDGSGGYLTPPGATEDLMALGGEFRLVTANTETRFGVDGTVSEIVTPDTGDRIIYTYTEGRVTRIAGPGRFIDLVYRPDGLLASATADDGRAVIYDYTAEGLLASVTSPAGRTTLYAYDASGRLVSVTDPAGVRVHETDYDAATGRVVAQRGPDGAQTTFGYDVDGDWTGTVTATMPDGGVWVDRYEKRVLVARTDPTGVTVEYAYDGQLRLTAFRGPDGTTTLDYDQAGRLVRTTRPDGGAHQSAYTPEGRLGSTTGADGLTTTYGYDAEGRLATVTGPDGATTTYGYGPEAPDGLPTEVTDPAGGVATFEYNPVGQATRVRSAGDLETTYTYTAEGWLATVTAPDGGTTTYTYDPDGILLTVTDPAGHTVTTTLDAGGRVSQLADDQGRSRVYAYDAAGRVASVTDHAGRSVSYAYDPAGRVVAKTDPNGHTATFTYDQAGRLIGVSDAQGTAAFTYDRGRLATATRLDGTVVTYTYDAFGRLTRVSAPGHDERFTYDTAGRLATHRRGATTVTYTYSGTHGRVASIRVADSDLGMNETTAYGYDSRGLVVEITRPNGTVDRFDHDPDGRITAVRRGSVLLGTRSYDTAGRLTSITGADGSEETFTYDLLSRPLERTVTGSGTVLDLERITYDTRGNPVVVVRPEGPTAYVFDDLDQLVRVCPGQSACDGTETVWEAFTYDTVGNRLTRSDAAGTDTYVYDTAGRLIRVDHGTGAVTALEYDGAGRVTQVGDLTLGYDQVTDELTSAGLPGGNTWEYGYDPHGRRLRTVTTTVSGNKTTTTTHLFAHDPLFGDLLRRQAGNKADTYLPLGLGRTDGQNAYAINHYDTVGSLRAVTGVHRNNTVTKFRYDYAAYGALAPASAPDPAQDLGFGSHPQGPADLWLMGGRPYHPALGRFLTPDPAGAGHVYANNSPVLYADPTGDIPCLGSWDAVRRCVAVVNPVADMVALVAGGITAGAALTGIGAPIAAVTGPIAIGAGAIGALGRTALTVDACLNTKGSCLSAVAVTSLELALYRVRLSSGANRAITPGTSYGSTGTVVPNPGIAIKGFQGSAQPGHAMNQIINRGVKPDVLLGTVRNPRVVLQQPGNRYLFLSDEAAVVMRGDGQVVTAWTRNEFLPHIWRILGDAGGAP